MIYVRLPMKHVGNDLCTVTHETFKEYVVYLRLPMKSIVVEYVRLTIKNDLCTVTHGFCLE